MEITRERKIELLKKMYYTRYFELKVKELFLKGRIKGSTHVYLGEEAIAAGACAAVNGDDYVLSTHRGHGHCIAKGGDLNGMMAEIMAKETGYCNGKGGSMHIADLNIGIICANGIVGGGLPLSVGTGLSSKYSANGRVTLCFFGDGAANQGSFHEAVNMASVMKLPVVYICENNGFAVTTPVSQSFNIENISIRAAGYGIEGKTIDGNDVEEVYKVVSKAVNDARNGKGPSIIECRTYRWDGHYIGDPETYRTKEEVANWKMQDPVLLYRSKLIKDNTISEQEAESLEECIKQSVEQAERFAEESPDPAPEDARSNIFAPAYEVYEPDKELKRGRITTYRDAINDALREEMERDKTVVILGEDIAEAGGAFQVTKGLWKKFGSGRVINTPLSEAAIAGAGVGGAITGLRPVIEIMYMDFLPLAMDQIVNQAAKMRYMFGGKVRLPLVIRSQCGVGKGGAAQHSQSLEAWFTHIPGLKIVVPSNPYDAKGLLKTAIREDNVVLFFEYKDLYMEKDIVPEGEYLIPFGKAAIRKEGKDVTVVATSRMVSKALNASKTLKEMGIDVEIIDPRTLAPLDTDTIINSVMKTHKLVICHDANKTCGIGAEIAALVTEKTFDYLKAPPIRVAALDTPVPFNVLLENTILPKEADIINAVMSVCDYRNRR